MVVSQFEIPQISFIEWDKMMTLRNMSLTIEVAFA